MSKTALRVEAVIELPDDPFDAADILSKVRAPIDEASRQVMEALGDSFPGFTVTVVKAKQPRAPRGSKKAEREAAAAARVAAAAGQANGQGGEPTVQAESASRSRRSPTPETQSA